MGDIEYKPVLPKNIDVYLWRPCTSEPPLCTYSQLKDGTYDINDLADMHEYLDIQEENKKRIQTAIDRPK